MLSSLCLVCQSVYPYIVPWRGRQADHSDMRMGPADCLPPIRSSLRNKPWQKAGLVSHCSWILEDAFISPRGLGRSLHSQDLPHWSQQALHFQRNSRKPAVHSLWESCPVVPRARLYRALRLLPPEALPLLIYVKGLTQSLAQSKRNIPPTPT